MATNGHQHDAAGVQRPPDTAAVDGDKASAAAAAAAAAGAPREKHPSSAAAAGDGLADGTTDSAGAAGDTGPNAVDRRQDDCQPTVEQATPVAKTAAATTDRASLITRHAAAADRHVAATAGTSGAARNHDAADSRLEVVAPEQEASALLRLPTPAWKRGQLGRLKGDGGGVRDTCWRRKCGSHRGGRGCRS